MEDSTVEKSRGNNGNNGIQLKSLPKKSRDFHNYSQNQEQPNKNFVALFAMNLVAFLSMSLVAFFTLNFVALLTLNLVALLTMNFMALLTMNFVALLTVNSS